MSAEIEQITVPSLDKFAVEAILKNPEGLPNIELNQKSWNNSTILSEVEKFYAHGIDINDFILPEYKNYNPGNVEFDTDGNLKYEGYESREEMGKKAPWMNVVRAMIVVYGTLAPLLYSIRDTNLDSAKLDNLVDSAILAMRDRIVINPEVSPELANLREAEHLYMFGKYRETELRERGVPYVNSGRKINNDEFIHILGTIAFKVHPTQTFE